MVTEEKQTFRQRVSYGLKTLETFALLFGWGFIVISIFLILKTEIPYYIPTKTAKPEWVIILIAFGLIMLSFGFQWLASRISRSSFTDIDEKTKEVTPKDEKTKNTKEAHN